MKILNKILEYVLAILVVVMVAGCIWQIVTRFILQNPSDWTEELVRYALIWMTMVGVPYAYGKQQHIAVTFITDTFTKKGTLKDKIFIEILVLFLSVFVMTAGGIMVSMNAAGQVSPALGIPMQFYYIGVPVCGVLMVVYAAERLIRFIKEFKELKKEEK
ncbi:TRAP transporter small permease [Clostridium sp. AF19-22AC]|jgi:TRAP-type C4-dicarboxylate transport system permease small subunit|uniref:TRAP-type C4-dicarboxylate transport system permease small subunit n=1 Tax=Faecalicatena orotica TaxID=1544 RepID=A0A2Y9BNR4_9FIRM|nr:MULTISPECIES: TRAP transporter small permease [Clostridia]PWJ16883.1 TRAP-type C4-dicarboxylate transport system permease small subunit [Faecalicatena orotica]RHR29851.1 TRAP transporter small permease [Clostridium sp. AF19-22AC]SSA58841.1 TRAP-type C4-dicarboxylate transport system, small permease component [Faecalicatena orotica]